MTLNLSGQILAYVAVAYREGIGKPPLRWRRTMKPSMLQALQHRGQLLTQPRWSIQYVPSDLEWVYIVTAKVREYESDIA